MIGFMACMLAALFRFSNFRPVARALVLGTGMTVALGGCAVVKDYQRWRLQREEDRAAALLRQQAYAEHSVFRAQKGWKSRTYRNEALLKQASPKNVSVEISLAEQRGFLLVRGAIAMDFPVATGRRSHPTPAGKYTVLGKQKEYSSNLYGKIHDATGAVVLENADMRADKVPEGGTFVGAMMPFWMRLTNDGVGLHVGYVPGRPASHGCVRLKRDTAQELFVLVEVGTPVTIAEKVPALEVPNPKTKD